MWFRLPRFYNTAQRQSHGFFKNASIESESLIVLLLPEACCSTMDVKNCLKFCNFSCSMEHFQRKSWKNAPQTSSLNLSSEVLLIKHEFQAEESRLHSLDVAKWCYKHLLVQKCWKHKWSTDACLKNSWKNLLFIECSGFEMPNIHSCPPGLNFQENSSADNSVCCFPLASSYIVKVRRMPRQQLLLQRNS